MEEITLERKRRIQMFFNEYYFGVPNLYTVLRIIGGPVIFAIGLTMYLNDTNRFGIGYGGMMVDADPVGVL